MDEEYEVAIKCQKEFTAYQLLLLSCLERIEKLIQNGDIEEAKKSVSSLIKNTERIIEDK